MRGAQVIGALVSVLAANAAVAAEYEFCLTVNRVAAAGKLRDYSDRQIENGLCMTTKELVAAISTKDSARESICMTSAEHMMREFKRRFPGRNAKDVSGKC